MPGPDTAKPILRLSHVTTRFGGVTANDDVDLLVDKHEVVGLIGPNGSGKTTLLNVVAGAKRPEAGHISFEGQEITGRSPADICRGGIARTFQLLRLFYAMTALENAMVGAFVRTRNPTAAAQVGREALAYVGLEHKADALAKTLSTGQRKRLELARALATEPKLLLLDEVLAGVDPGNRAPIISLLERVRERGVTVLMVEHNLEVVRALCDRVVALDQGTKIAEGSASAVLSDERVVESYLGGVA